MDSESNLGKKKHTLGVASQEKSSEAVQQTVIGHPTPLPQNQEEIVVNKDTVEAVKAEPTPQIGSSSIGVKKTGFLLELSELRDSLNTLLTSSNAYNVVQSATNLEASSRYIPEENQLVKPPIVQASTAIFTQKTPFGYGQRIPKFEIGGNFSMRTIEINKVRPLITVISQSSDSSQQMLSANQLQFSKEVIDLIIAPSKMFSRGLALAILTLNREYVEQTDIDLENNVPLANAFLPVMSIVSSTPSFPSVDTDITKFIAGIFHFVITVGLEFDAIPFCDKSQLVHVSQATNNGKVLRYLKERFIRTNFPNPQVLNSISGLDYVDDALDIGSQNFELGYVRSIEQLRQNVSLKSLHATTLDNVTIELIGITMNYYNTHGLSRENFRTLVQAHCLSNTIINTSSEDFKYSLKVILPESVSAIHILCYTLARAPNFRVQILQTYLDAFIHFGIFQRRSTVEEDFSENNILPDARAKLNGLVASSDFDDLIVTVVLQISPTLDFPVLYSVNPTELTSAMLYLFETVLFFVIAPKTAKFVAYELCNRMRIFFRRFLLEEWYLYVANIGYLNGIPGTDAAASREGYLAGIEVPTFLNGYHANTSGSKVSSIFSTIATLIQPVGAMYNPGNFDEDYTPRIDRQVFLPYAPLSNNIDDDNLFSDRLRLIIHFFSGTLAPKVIVKAVLAGVKKSSLIAMFTIMFSRVRPVMIATSIMRACLKPLSGFYTNFVQSYDGHLNTKIPGPLVIEDKAKGTQPYQVQSTDETFFVDTSVIWALLYRTSGVYESAYLGDSEPVKVVNVNGLDPQEELGNQLACLNFAVNITKSAGYLYHVFFDKASEPSLGIRLFRGLMREARSIGLSSSDFRRLEQQVWRTYQMIRKKSSEEPGGESATFVGSGILESPFSNNDARMTQPVLSRGDFFSGLQIQQPNSQIFGGNLQLLNDRDRLTCDYLFNLLLDPSSQMSRMQVGIGLQRRTELSITYISTFTMRFEKVVLLGRKNFVTAVGEHGMYVGFRQDAQDPEIATDPCTFPNCTIMISDVAEFDNSQLSLLAEAVNAGRCDIILSKLRFTYSTKFLERNLYGSIVQPDLLQLIRISSTKIIPLEFYHTYITAFSFTHTISQSLIRYIYPMQALDLPVIMQDAIHLQQSASFIPPDPHLYDTGRLSSDWVNTDSQNQRKSYRNISLANQIILIDKDSANISLQAPNIEVRGVSQLDIFT